MRLNVSLDITQDRDGAENIFTGTAEVDNEELLKIYRELYLKEEVQCSYRCIYKQNNQDWVLTDDCLGKEEFESYFAECRSVNLLYRDKENPITISNTLEDSTTYKEEY